MGDRLISAEAVDDPSFLKVIGSHLHFHPIAGENAHAMHAHPSCKMAMELVVLRLRTYDPDAEGGIRERLFNETDELYDIFRHRKQ